jgi:hypothetical protein
MAIEIAPGVEAVTGCDQCGHESRTFRGSIYEGNQALGIYLAAYTESHPELGVSMAVSLHGWGEDADTAAKECVALEWRNAENGPGCAIVDAKDSIWAKEAILGLQFSRELALSTGRAHEVFAITDLVWSADERLRAALGGS